MAVLTQVLILVAYLTFAIGSVVLAVVDIRQKRLPDRIVLPTLGLVTVLLAAGAAVAGEWWRLTLALAVSAGLFLLYLLLAFAGAGALGGGDVKLAALIGLVLGFAGWDAVLVGVLAGFVLGAIGGFVVLWGARRGRRRSALPLGPFMLAGAWFGLILTLLIPVERFGGAPMF